MVFSVEHVICAFDQLRTKWITGMKCEMGWRQEKVGLLRKVFSAKRDSFKNLTFLCELKMGDITLSVGDKQNRKASNIAKCTVGSAFVDYYWQERTTISTVLLQYYTTLICHKATNVNIFYVTGGEPWYLNSYCDRVWAAQPGNRSCIPGRCKRGFSSTDTLRPGLGSICSVGTKVSFPGVKMAGVRCLSCSPMWCWYIEWPDLCLVPLWQPWQP